MSILSNHSLSREAVLRKKHDFRKFFNNARVVRMGTFLVFVLDNKKDTARFGVTVKGRPNSVHRNACKRAVREWFRTKQHLLPHIDLNFVVKFHAGQLPHETVNKLKHQLNIISEQVF